ncbi:MAG: hypothetical protein DHS80DRAFT_32069 [Piptocephalis tieghemiana]|nr:MAG: hypothetical protein DHS80DRAFT_32069 [Piptocephalis tieghemiana]
MSTPAALSEKTVEAVTKVSEKLQAITNDFEDHVLALQVEYELKKQEAYEERQKAISEIPGFWAEVISNHPFTGALVNPNEQEILAKLRELRVERKTDDPTYTKLIFDFGENDYFQETQLTRSVKGKDEAVTIVPATITWKDADKGKEIMSDGSFFDFITSSTIDGITEVIANELFPQALDIYQGVDDDSDEEGSVDLGEDTEEDEEEEEEDESPDAKKRKRDD